MTLVSAARYIAITGDTTFAATAVDAALAEAQELLEDELGRQLEDTGADRSERLKMYSDAMLGFVVYPTVTPITDAGDQQIVGAAITGVTADNSPFFWTGVGDSFATVTYRGGFTADTVPACVERDIGWNAYSLLRPANTALVPVGVTAASVGDVSVTYDHAQAASEAGVRWSRSTLRYRKRRI